MKNENLKWYEYLFNFIFLLLTFIFTLCALTCIFNNAHPVVCYFFGILYLYSLINFIHSENKFKKHDISNAVKNTMEFYNKRG